MLKANNFSQLLPAHKVSGNIKMRTIKLNYGFYFCFYGSKTHGRLESITTLQIQDISNRLSGFFAFFVIDFSAMFYRCFSPS